jgi:23S rRNA (cytosine1962-C5)-methyltransferase
MIKIILKPGKDQSPRRFHPWIFSGAIKKIYGEPVEGDVVAVHDSNDELLGYGHYQPGSIAVRLLSFGDEYPGEAFFRKRLDAAIAYRKAVGLMGSGDTNVYRLIHAEGDGLPGLVIDYYDGVAVMQNHSVGMYREREVVAGLLKEMLGEQLMAVYDKSEGTLPFMAGVNNPNGFLLGDTGPVTVTENGFKFKIDWTTGQKTGFFVDQRENRRLLGEYTGGRRVLNMFGYTGGFSVYAMKNAVEVHTVDSSAPAIEMARENVALNFGDDKRHTAYQTDAFTFLNDIKDKYDLIILDPPAFAKHQRVLDNALMGYKKLNMKAIEQIAPGGIIFTFSCSQVVSKEDFRRSVFVAAANTGRKVRILHQLSQPVDHPVNIYHPESEYLKGLVLFVE